MKWIIYMIQLQFLQFLEFIPCGNIGTHKWPVPNVSGFIAQLVSVASVSRGHRFKPGWSPEIFRLLYAIAKIAFITANIIVSLDFISAVHIYDPFHISFHHWFIPYGNIGTPWSPEFFRLLYAIAKIAFTTVRVIASSDVFVLFTKFVPILPWIFKMFIV